jgi:hypothetical protein
MIIEKRSGFSGINGDDSPRLIDDKSCLNAMNVRMAVTENGRNLRWENIPGTALVTQNVFPPYGTQQTIGSAQDEDNGRLLFFNFNSFGDHGIYCYDPLLNRIFTVIYDSQIIGGLKFSRNSLIHSARVVNGNLYWCDSTNNEPRRININAGINMNLLTQGQPVLFPDVVPYKYSMNQTVLYWIRKQPSLILTAQKKTNGSYNNNFIKNEAFQFSWRYIFRDYETSTLSGLSALVNFNLSTDSSNYITVTAPTGEFIDQDVVQVDFVVKYLLSGKSFVFKSWNTNVPADFNAIYAHNYGGIPLAVDFYNDILGNALDDAYTVKPYDSVPIYAQTIEMARFRSFMANYTIGYNTPSISSLNAAAVISNTSTLTGQWIQIDYNFGASTHYFIYLGTFGIFDAPQPSPPPFPASVAYGTMTLVAPGLADFALYIINSGLYPGWINGVQWPGATSTITGGPPVPGIAGTTAFKSGSSDLVTISFFDHSGRKCGIVTPGVKVNTGERQYDQLQYTTGINWSLSNINAVNEIPDWAYYYTINITKCLTTRFFLQSRVKNITYATKNTTGDYVFNTSAYATNLNGVAVDITLLNAYGMGYNFSEGDLIKIYINGDSTVHNLSIIAQDGNWIICELSNLGSIGNTASPKTDVLFEIYTPYRPSVSEPNYETTIYKVNNPTTNSRTYSVVAGTLTGDVTILTRNDGTNDYLTENMSPNDKFFNIWNTSTGRQNFVDTVGQVVKTNQIAFSNTIIEGTKTNGLSTFDALDTKDISLECGDIRKLQVANKVFDDQGTIMLAICERQVASCYLSETQLVGQAANAFVGQTTDVIGTVNLLQGSYGTENAESVVEYLGLVMWFDVLNGMYIQYSNNGLFPVSNYKMSRFWKNYSKEYRASSSGNLDNINGFHHVRSCIDPFFREIVCTLPALIYDNYANTLPSYTSVPTYASSILDRFDISDQLGKTMGFQYEDNKWGSNYEYKSEWMEYLQNQMYGFKNGNLYIHNSDTTNWNKFFGISRAMRICVPANINPSQLKDLATIAVETNESPDFAVAKTNYPNVQITDLAGIDFVDQQSNLYSPWFRDRLDPNSSGTASQKLYTGAELTDISIFVMVEWNQSAYDQLVWCNFINVGWQLSRGQQQIANPINK